MGSNAYLCICIFSKEITALATFLIFGDAGYNQDTVSVVSRVLRAPRLPSRADFLLPERWIFP